MIKVLAFDFDGVIVDSNRLKFDAWFKIFPAELGITKEEISESLNRVGSTTRFNILRDIFFKKSIPVGEKCEKLVVEYAEKFNQVVQGGIVLMPGATDILSLFSEKFALYVNSATPIEPVLETVNRLDITHYFKEVLGYPPEKIENLRNILTREKASPEELVFVGDGENDLSAARAMGCRFIGFQNEFNGWSEPSDFPLIKNLPALLEVIEVRLH